MAIEIDPFAQKFRDLAISADAVNDERRGMIFRYFYLAGGNGPRDWLYMAGLWVSREYNRRQIETVHFLPDRECERAVQSAGGHHKPSVAIWQGLLVSQVEVSGVKTYQFSIPQGILDNYAGLVLDQQTPLKDELEARFGVLIDTQNA